MKIYFTASIYQSNNFGENYKLINSTLKNLGYDVISDHIIGVELNEISTGAEEDRRAFYKKVVKWIKDCNILVAEVSFPSSVNIGHEITLGLENEKPVLALYQKGFNPIFLEGNTNEKFILIEYDPTNPKELERIIKSSLKKLIKATDIRFNFFISPEIVRYLDWVAKVKRVPRSVYLRDLIEDDMKKHKDYGTQG